MSDLSMMAISEVSRLIRQKKVSPREVVEEVICNTRRLQHLLNVNITFLEDVARAQAAKLTAEMPGDLESRPLYGIPYGLKDLYYTKDILTTGASQMYSGYRPEYDATVVSRLRAAGAILMGKHNMHELAFGATSAVSCYGPVRNPYDPTKIAGGSSGGSAVAVATGMNYMALGSDSGGSIRIPASICGVVGFKPSQGMVSLYGTISLCESLDTAGPLTRSVLDAAIVMDAITGFEPLDSGPNRYMGKQTCFARSIENADRLDGVRIGVPENYFFDKVDVSIERLVREAIQRMEDLGAKLIPVKFDFLQDLPDVSLKLVLSESAWTYRKELAENPAQFSDMVRNRLQSGEAITATEYISAVKRRQAIIAVWNDLMHKVDAVVCPTLPLTAFPIEGDMQVTLRGKQEDGFAMLTQHTRLSNLTGSPALSLPVGLADNGLPAGMMIMGAAGDDVTVLKVGHVYEKHFPFSYRQF